MYDSLGNGRVRRRRENVMGKIASAIVTVILAAGSLWLSAPARAENGQIAAGVVRGLIGGALQHVVLRRRFITRQSRSKSKSQPVVWFASVTGMDMAGNSAESRFATDRQSTYKKEARAQETPSVFVLVDLFGRLSHALARSV